MREKFIARQPHLGEIASSAERFGLFGVGHVTNKKRPAVPHTQNGPSS